MKRILRLLGTWAIVIGAFWLAGVRGRMRDQGLSFGYVVSHDLRRFVTDWFNPLVMGFGLAGGRRSPWAVLEHVGRTSGTTYYTPIYALTAGDHAFVRLTYGTDVHWVRNVQAAGHCRMQAHETIFELDEPAIIPASDNPLVPPALRGTLDRSGRKYLRLHVLDRAPGTFAWRPPELASEPITSRPPALVIHAPEPTSGVVADLVAPPAG
jgi:deazaflavin-dependent oxidoreductase (nitroreductase family)